MMALAKQPRSFTSSFGRPVGARDTIVSKILDGVVVNPAGWLRIAPGSFDQPNGLFVELCRHVLACMEAEDSVPRAAIGSEQLGQGIDSRRFICTIDIRAAGDPNPRDIASMIGHYRSDHRTWNSLDSVIPEGCLCGREYV